MVSVSTKENGTVSKDEPAPPTPSEDLLGDLLGPLAIEGPPAAAAAASTEQNPLAGLEAAPNSVGALALATLDDQANSVQVLYFRCFFTCPV